MTNEPQSTPENPEDQTPPEIVTPPDSTSDGTPKPYTFRDHRIPQEQAKKQYNRKYAYWAWCPSQGYLYGDEFPGGEVVLSPMTTSEEKILQQAGKDRMEIIDELVKRCLVKCPVPYDELLIPDMLYMLLVIRNITYGKNYLFRLECNRCKLEYRNELELPQGLTLKCLDAGDDNEPWEVTLPQSGDRIQYRLLRMKDEVDIRRWGRQSYQRSIQVGDPTYVYRISKHIVAINGQELDAVKRLDYTEDMIGGDSNALRKAIEKHDFGVRLTLDSTCPGCGYASQTRLPFDKEFFRPSDGEGGV